MKRALIFARAAMMDNVLKEMRVGYMGKNPDIMFSMQVDEYGLKKIFGVTVIPFRDFEYTDWKDKIPEEEAKKDWNFLKKQVGTIEIKEEDALDASKSYLAMMRLSREKSLDALSVNCWAHLKSKVCLPISRMNEAGVGSGCEGDLHSTILLRLLYLLTGKPALNGDFLRLIPEKNQIVFSHCGAAAFSLAESSEAITLHASIETKDGIGVFFPVEKEGEVTALNLIGSRASYRLSVLSGRAVKEVAVYEGNPMNIHFEKPVSKILKDAVEHGAGHHWNIVYGDYTEECRLLCRMKGVEFILLS
jgi:L-fucose isomerase-like protein